MFLKRLLGLAAFFRAATFEPVSQISGKDIHCQASLQDVIVGNGDRVKGGHDHFPALSRESGLAIACLISSM